MFVISLLGKELYRTFLLVEPFAWPRCYFVAWLWTSGCCRAAPLNRDAACRFLSVRAGGVFDVLRFVPVRAKIRLRVRRSVSRVSETGLRVMRVGIGVSLCAFVCLCVSCVTRVVRVA
jgi:hypothetical protein